MSRSLKDVCFKIGLTTGISPATIYEWQRALVAAGVLVGRGRGPGSGVRATPQNIAILLIRLMFAGGPAPAATDLHYWRSLKRTEIWGARFEGEPRPTLDVDSDWPASGEPTFGRALTALLGNVEAAALVEAIELNRALEHAVIYLRNRQTRKRRKLRFGRQRRTKHEPFIVIARLHGSIFPMLVAAVMNDPSDEHEGEES